MKLPKKKCARCEELFDPPHPLSLYCTDKCMMRHLRNNKYKPLNLFHVRRSPAYYRGKHGLRHAYIKGGQLYWIYLFGKWEEENYK